MRKMPKATSKVIAKLPLPRGRTGSAGKPSVCAEYILPLVKLGGLAILYRGHWEEEDTASLDLAVRKLGGEIELIHSQKTPITKSIRHCIYLRKHLPIANKYPRAVGVANQKPL